MYYNNANVLQFIRYNYIPANTNLVFSTQLRIYLPCIYRLSEIPDFLTWKFYKENTPGSYARIYQHLNSNGITTGNITRKEVCMLVGRGLIAEVDFSAIHFLMVYNKYFKESSSLAHHRLYLSPEFIEPKGRFRLIYKRFYDDWLSQYMKQGLDVVITRDILSFYNDMPENNHAGDFEAELARLRELPKLLADGQ